MATLRSGMNTPLRLASFFSAAVFFAGLAHADVTLAPLFTDHAVLQRDKSVPVWGHAQAGEKITVTFAGHTVQTTADANGRWTTSLPALEASGESRDFVVTGNNTVTLSDVVVGEVWLCSGQSNMAFMVRQAQNAPAEIAAANFPLIRQVQVERAVETAPVETGKTKGWQAATPEKVGEFTAVGYYFARDLHRKLGVPIGLINSSWGGTPVESWMSPAAVASQAEFSVITERWQKKLAEYPDKKAAYDLALPPWTEAEAKAKAAGEKQYRAFLKATPKPIAPVGQGHPWTPMSLFNGMINPLLPYALRGALWYQGESNANHADEYHALFSAMITAWRAHFGQGDFPFYWVQLANFNSPSDPSGITWAFLREAQTQTLSLPQTGQTITIDIGEANDIHPTNKQEVGRRLALIAKIKTYGIAGDCEGPTFASATPEKNALRVRFTHLAGGLVAHSKPSQSLQVAGADRKFYPATGVIERDGLLVSAPGVKEPVAVRYAWSNSPEANLYNSAGLPVVPFRSDRW